MATTPLIYRQLADDGAVENPHGSANALDLALATAPGTIERPDGTTATIEMEVANAIWAQQGFGFEQPFLVTLAENYGAGTHLVVDDPARPHQRRPPEGALAAPVR